MIRIQRSPSYFNYVQGSQNANAQKDLSQTIQQGDPPLRSQIDPSKYSRYEIIKVVGTRVTSTNTSTHYLLVIKPSLGDFALVYLDVTKSDLERLGYWTQNVKLDQDVPIGSY